MRVHFIVHEAFEAPGAFIPWAQQRGYETSFSRVYEHDSLPASVGDIDLLVVMGGPQSPATTLEECPHFDAKAEQHLIRQCIDAGRAVVGVCLGAQLIGEALGAPFRHSPEKEIGAFPITFTDAGKAHPKFQHFGGSAAAGHWHNDMPGITDGATIIAISEGCPRQIVEYTSLVYGLQCHMEFTPEVIEMLIAHSEVELAASKSHRFVQQPDALRRNDYATMNAQLMRFLDALVDELKRTQVSTLREK
jgi:GMP synthase (glutamine-hydrolysing)